MPGCPPNYGGLHAGKADFSMAITPVNQIYCVLHLRYLFNGRMKWRGRTDGILLWPRGGAQLNGQFELT